MCRHLDFASLQELRLLRLRYMFLPHEKLHQTSDGGAWLLFCLSHIPSSLLETLQLSFTRADMEVLPLIAWRGLGQILNLPRFGHLQTFHITLEYPSEKDVGVELPSRSELYITNELQESHCCRILTFSHRSI